MADMVHGEEEGNDDDESGESGESGESEESEEEEESEERDEEMEGGEEEDHEIDEEPTETLDEKDEEKEVTEGDVCFHCHQPGHKARKCPLLHPELKKEPRMKEKKNITDLQIRDRVIHYTTFDS